MTTIETREYIDSLREFSKDEKFNRFLMLLNMRAADKKMYQVLKEGNPSVNWSQFDLLLMDLEDLRSGAYNIGGE
ncbi:MAG: hypothetical protein ACRDDH_09250 [Cetobacterium sp.]|uniref:hypothetical protein n=1 Tax=Cetobacterium sp. TaxID=2071632 RepID=UPI003EE5E92D